MQLGATGIENHPDGTGQINGILNGNWALINEAHNLANGITSSQTSLTVTASAAVFTAEHVGATIRWADGKLATITGFTDSTHASVTPSQTVASQSFEVYRTDQTSYTLLARGIMKKVRFVTGDDKKTVQWNQTAQRFDFVDKPGFNIAAGRVLLGGGTTTDLTSSASFTFDTATGLMVLVGMANIQRTIYGDITAANITGSASIDGALSNTFDLTLTGNVTALDMTNIKAGALYRLVLRQDGTGGRTLAFAAKFKLVNGAVVGTISGQAANMVAVYYVNAISATELFTTT